jgi:hypothetical protein
MKSQTTGKIIVAVLAVLSGVTFFACSCSCTDSQSNVPDNIFKSSNSFIVSRVGQDFFDNYIKPDYTATKKIKSKYFMVYELKMPDKPYVDGKIKFEVDSTGNVINQENVSGLPDCGTDPGKCEFNINEEQARQIAKDNDFKEGIKDWKVEFKWDPKYDQYVWSILSTLEESQGSFGTRGSGEIILIDPNSGRVISTDTWRIM